MSTSKKLAITFFTLASFFLNDFAYGQEEAARLMNVPNGEEMIKICVREGATNVVNQFDKRDWDILGERVATGDRYWIEASACLVQGKNFFIFEDIDPDKRLGDYADAVLRDAWQKVLLKTPEIILELGEKIPLEWVCRYPYEAAWDYKTVEVVDEYLDKMLAALARVDNEDLQLDKEICEIYLKHYHKIFREDLANQQKRD